MVGAHGARQSAASFLTAGNACVEAPGTMRSRQPPVSEVRIELHAEPNGAVVVLVLAAETAWLAAKDEPSSVVAVCR